MKNFIPVFIIALALASCTEKPGLAVYSPTNEAYFSNSGRQEAKDSSLVLISAASRIAFRPSADTLTVFCRNDREEQHSYLSLAINKKYRGRFRINSDTLNHIALSLSENDTLVELYKATEASTGNLLIEGIATRSLRPAPEKPDIRIEFIGNSITSGFGNDTEEIPCGEGTWYDQHNAFYSYATLAANQLDCDFLLSSVSGYGMYRNWNSDGPTLPEVYDKLYLDTNNPKSFTPEMFRPDLVSICLGTNDLSDGDGTAERAEFDPDRFTETYIRFVTRLAATRPGAKIALLDSPMVTGEKSVILQDCLKRVQQHFAKKGRKIYVFNFTPLEIGGCLGHPSIANDRNMASQLLPFYRNILKDVNNVNNG
ncbi:GDSL-type esterase/lipase family protein [Sinomicrobium kalidii]|uniref:SGNH/GDSL hydrolase family protein n=1 Tax=Sinomicrobium kalidii TaxID=2900738 RepID=UPI001E362C06|nr:SGNH/GDSL hydrolase family protein [Sinomicrobium kalidii]UGU17889.1 GDSL-type esterase/lipase family protein [Sinomicrobium kalidii]